MPILKNSRHEKFAQLVANGKSATAAYSIAYESTTTDKLNDAVCRASASRLLASINVSARIAELKQRGEAKAAITRDEIIEILAEYARNRPGKLYPHDTRLKAMSQLTKMTGWDAPEKVELSANNELTELLKRLRGGG